MGNRHSQLTDSVTACGLNSIPVDDIHNAQDRWIGFHTATNTFCDWATTEENGGPAVVKPGEKLSHDIYESSWGWKVATNDHQDPNLNTSPAYVSFEISNNQKDEDLTMSHDICVNYLMKLADKDSECYGAQYGDTKGGIIEIEDGQVKYQVLAQKVSDQADSWEKD
ncbi:MAG: hypothetical protein M1831_002378 [Alyxoria varia]|nr:MAG: hypothetical protein M1831_002378 [Alyxoria varia]